MNKKNEVLLIYPNYSTFVIADFKILSKSLKVKKIRYVHGKNIKTQIVSQIKLFGELIKNIYNIKLIYVWFADYHSLLPILFGKIFRKKTIIIVGGYDAVSIPDIEFGLFFNKNLRIRILMAKMAYKNASCILPVDESLVEGINNYLGNKKLNIGVKSFIKNIKTDFITIPTGYNSRKWFKKNVSSENTVLTIGIASNMRTFKRKGLDLYLEIAKKLSEYDFIIIGLRGEVLKYAQSIATPNVKIYRFVENNLLVDYYSSAKVYCQLSISEGLPNTLCEAMLCECIPVGSNVNGIPKAIGNCGFILKKKSVKEATELVFKALNSNNKLGQCARNRIIENFSVAKRENQIFDLLEKWNIIDKRILK